MVKRLIQLDIDNLELDITWLAYKFGHVENKDFTALLSVELEGLGNLIFGIYGYTVVMDPTQESCEKGYNLAKLPKRTIDAFFSGSLASPLAPVHLPIAGWFKGGTELIGIDDTNLKVLCASEEIILETAHSSIKKYYKRKKVRLALV